MKEFLKDLFNIPNTLSVFRVLTAPFLAVLWLGLDLKVIGLIVGTVSGLTDMLDGYLARRLKQTTELGALIDQLGDLVFESVCLLICIIDGHLWSGLLVIYLFREFFITVMRTYLGNKGKKLPSGRLGKIKSAIIQWSFFPMFLGILLDIHNVIPEKYYLFSTSPGEILVWIAITSITVGIWLGLISGWNYFKSFVKIYIQLTR